MIALDAADCVRVIVVLRRSTPPETAAVVTAADRVSLSGALTAAVTVTRRRLFNVQFEVVVVVIVVVTATHVTSDRQDESCSLLAESA